MAELISGVRYIDALIYGTDALRWNRDEPVGSPASVTYSFLTEAPAYVSGDLLDADGNYDPSTFYPFTAAQRAAAQSVLGQYSEIANLTFVQEADDADAIMHFARNDQTYEGSIAYAYAPYRAQYPVAGDVWLSTTVPDNNNVTPGEQGYATLLHEVGHALGLKHSFYPGRTEVRLTGAENTEEYTVMAYKLHPYATFYSAHGGVRWIEASTPMLYDVAAIQYLYGANQATRAGDDVYSFAPYKPFLMCIWDGGGVDTVSVARFTLGCDIDLRDGHFSDITILSAPSPIAGEQVYDGTKNLSIAYGAVIENATGGGGSDVLHGNDAVNVLRGGGGDDTLVGAAGADRLVGGTGTDAFVFDFPRPDADVIVDFETGVDHLQFNGAGFASLAGMPPDQMFTDGYLIYHPASGRLYYDADGDGVDAQLIAKLAGHPALAADDIIVK